MSLEKGLFENITEYLENGYRDLHNGCRKGEVNFWIDLAGVALSRAARRGFIFESLNQKLKQLISDNRR